MTWHVCNGGHGCGEGCACPCHFGPDAQPVGGVSQRRRGHLKRQPALGSAELLALYFRQPKAVLAEALLDLWQEHHAIDCHPHDLSPAQVELLEREILTRAELKQRQCMRRGGV